MHAVVLGNLTLWHEKPNAAKAAAAFWSSLLGVIRKSVQSWCFDPCQVGVVGVDSQALQAGRPPLTCSRTPDQQRERHWCQRGAG